MAQKALLRYTFLFDPAEAWSHLSQFENDLGDFFAANDMQVTIIKPVGGQIGERIMEIQRMDFVSKATNNNTPDIPRTAQNNPVSPQAILKQMKGTNITPKGFKEFQQAGLPKEAMVNRKVTKREQQFKQGKIMTRKGYLKR